MIKDFEFKTKEIRALLMKYFLDVKENGLHKLFGASNEDIQRISELRKQKIKKFMKELKDLGGYYPATTTITSTARKCLVIGKTKTGRLHYIDAEDIHYAEFRYKTTSGAVTGIYDIPTEEDSKAYFKLLEDQKTVKENIRKLEEKYSLL